MSFRAVAWALDQRTGSPLSKLVLLKLADAANDTDGRCFPSIATIARETEMSPRSVIRHIKRLLILYLLRIEHRKENGVHLVNNYLIPFREGGGSDTQSLLLTECHKGSDPQSQGVVTHSHPNRSSLNRSINRTPIVPTEGETDLLGELTESVKHQKQMLAFSIYQAYPKKVGRPKALVAIQKALKSYPAKFLLERTQLYAEARNDQEMQFCPSPARWFNEERFNDDPSTWKPNKPQKKKQLSYDR